jgi:hypothetical protein
MGQGVKEEAAAGNDEESAHGPFPAERWPLECHLESI